MTVSFTRDLSGGGWRGWFVVKNNSGTLRTGIAAGNFTATVVNPQDSANTVPAVAESVQKPGLYSFLIPDAFLATWGLGSYGTVIEVSSGPVKDAIGSSFGYFEGTVGRRTNSWVRGKVEIQNDNEIVYFDEAAITALFRNEKLDSSRNPLAP